MHVMFLWRQYFFLFFFFFSFFFLKNKLVCLWMIQVKTAGPAVVSMCVFLWIGTCVIYYVKLSKNRQGRILWEDEIQEKYTLNGAFKARGWRILGENAICHASDRKARGQWSPESRASSASPPDSARVPALLLCGRHSSRFFSINITTLRMPDSPLLLKGRGTLTFHRKYLFYQITLNVPLQPQFESGTDRGILQRFASGLFSILCRPLVTLLLLTRSWTLNRASQSPF